MVPKQEPDDILHSIIKVSTAFNNFEIVVLQTCKVTQNSTRFGLIVRVILCVID